VKIYGSYDEIEEELMIIVEDTGAGMSQHKIAKLFKTFTKILKNKNSNRDGVGLGLTLSKNIA
jgi:two-component system, OmpR family, phosphate regulon sensor histidine kinase PhoR